MDMDTIDYRREFLANVPGPYTCFFCKEPVTIVTGRMRKSLVVHHKDGDRSNNRRSNWKPAHAGCHMSHHMKGNKRRLGKLHTPETRAKMSQSRKGNQNRLGSYPTAETREKLSAARVGNQNAKGNRSWRGRKHSEDTKAKMRAAWARRKGMVVEGYPTS